MARAPVAARRRELPRPAFAWLGVALRGGAQGLVHGRLQLGAVAAGIADRGVLPVDRPVGACMALIISRPSIVKPDVCRGARRVMVIAEASSSAIIAQDLSPAGERQPAARTRLGRTSMEKREAAGGRRGCHRFALPRAPAGWPLSPVVGSG
jgi:hypothetical protein